MAKKAWARVPALVNDSSDRDEDPRSWSFREQELSKEWLFQGKDERGFDGWFLRLEVTGLYPRRVGPFSSQEKALECLEEFLGEVAMGPLCEIGNTVGDVAVCVTEGIPRLTAID